jgi:hypothetical protein
MKKISPNVFAGIITLIVFMQIGWAQTVPANAQPNISMMSLNYVSDGQSKLAGATHYGDLEGSPYLYDGWGTGEARLADGKAYKNLFLQYDEIQGTVSFKYALTDTALAFAVPAAEFAFSYIANNKVNIVRFLNGFEPIGDANKSTYYQVLAIGKIQLLKRTIKKITKQQEYGSAQTKQIVTETTNYYLAGEDKKPIRIKNDNKAVLEALSNKADKLKQYIKDNNLNAKNDDELAKIITYYNTI